ncbi:MAG TPA: multicopper oxidase domain-containing protein, partial [Candidatus Angelobacter sp.]|nr:multicopper oxidase domain-containing protein [Candidatus Angelobacter sp.]
MAGAQAPTLTRIPCVGSGLPLVPIPEIGSTPGLAGTLQGVVFTADQQRNLWAAPSTVAITQTALTNNVATYTSANNFVPGELVTVINAANGATNTNPSPFNVTSATIVSASASQFTVTVQNPDIPQSAESLAVAAIAAPITQAAINNGVVTYTAANNFSPGNLVTVTGATPSVLNVNNLPVVSASATQFTVQIPGAANLSPQPSSTTPPTAAQTFTCTAPVMRYYSGYPESQSASWWANWLKQHSIGAQEPIPGPTLRTRVGDQIQILFLNQINPQDFSNSQDLAQCDISSNGYPGSDTFPDCIHSSTTTNIHFHGTHTTPSTTGDNVLLQILANPNGKTPATPPVPGFFNWCANSGTPSNWPPPSPIKPGLPTPSAWFGQFATLQMGSPTTGKGLIGQYDVAQKTPFSLWESNNKVIQANGWPQYYYGAFPYCFKLPDYNKGGVKMGQAPGTHWYHAHKHGSTNINVANGMTGALIIEGSYDDWLNSIYGQTNNKNNLQQQVLMLQQLGVAPNIKKIVNPPNFPGPTTISVNGRLQPVVAMQPGQVQLWRIVNSAPRDLLTLCPPANINWQLLARDGVQLAFQNVQNNQPVSLAAGNRADLLVQVPTAASGTISVNVFSAALAPPASPAANCTAGKDPAGDAYGPLLSINVQGNAISPAQQLLTAANYNQYWIAGMQTAVNAVIMPLANNPGGYFFQATTAGTTGKTTPLFQNAQAKGTTITDGTVTWTNIGPQQTAQMPIQRFLADIQPTEVRLHRELVFNSVVNSTTAAPTSAPPPVVVNPNPPPDLTPGTAKKFPPTNSHYINDVQFSDQRVDQAMLVDTVEEWKVMNFTNLAPGPNPWHPFHIHINPFQVTEVFNPEDPNTLACINPLDPATWHPCSPLNGPFVWWDVFA